MSFPTLDQSLPWTKKTNRTLENELSNARSVVALNQENESNSWKWAFQHSISRCPEPSKRIELLKMSFPTFDQSLPWTKETNRTLENELSNIRSVVALNQENESNSWKWAFQHSISRCPEPSNVGKIVFKSSIRLLGSGQRLIECWKARFQEFDSFLGSGQRLIECWKLIFKSSRFVFLVQGNDWRNESNSWKRAFQHSISRCPEPSNVGKLIFKCSIRFLGSGQRLQSTDWSSVTTDQMLESSFSRVRFVFLVQGNDWSSVGKLIFKSSIRLLGSGQRLIECWKAHFQEFDSFSWFRATTEVNESNFWKWAFQHSISRCPEPSSVGKLIFKSSIRFLGSGQGLIERWKAHFQEFDSFSWFRATTSKHWLIERWKDHFQEFDSFSWFRATTDRALKAHFQEFDSFSWFRATTDRMLKAHFQEFDLFSWFRATTEENESNSWKWAFNARSVVALNQENKSNSWKWAFNIRSVVALNQENESNSWKRAFQHSISRCPEPRKRIELLKMSFPTLDQSLPWTKKTNRTLENELSNIRSVVALNQVNESNSWKRAFQHSISRCPEQVNESNSWKLSFPTFDQSLPWTKKTNRTLENELSNARSVVALNQVNESNTWKRAFQHSISPCPEPRKRIELLKTSFPTFDQSLPWTKKTNRTLENELSNARSVVALNQENESNSWKWAFQRSISRCPEPRKRIELLKMSFPTLDQSLPWTKKTNRTLENELFNIRSVVALKSLPWTKKTNRTLENELSNARSVFALNQENESNSWKWAFQHSISRCPEPRKRSNSWKWAFQHSISRCPEPSSVTTDQMLESSFSRVRFVYLVQGNDWSSVGKLVFKSSIRLLGSGQRLIECWKAHFQEFDSFSWFRATTEVNESNSWKRAFQHSISRCPEPSSVGKLIFKSSIRFLGSGQGLIERWKAHFQEFDSFSWFRATTSRQRLIERWKARFQEFDSFSWFRATTDRALESSFSRVRFVFLVQGNDWSNVGKLIFKSSICFLGSGQGPIECWKARFQEFDSFLGSGQRLKKTNRTLENELSNARSVVALNQETNRTLENELSNIRSVLALNQENKSNSWKWAFQHSISRCPEPRKRIELLKMSFPTLDQSLPWTKKTNRTLENELSNIRSVVALNQENESNSWKRAFHIRSVVALNQVNESNSWKWVFQRSISRCLNQENESNSWKWAFQRSISRCPEPSKRIELLKTSFPTLDQSLPWTKKTNRTLENELSNIRSVVALNQENDSNSWKWAFQRSISRCPEPRKRIELLKMSFPTLDQSLPWTKKTNRTLENELSNARSVVALNQENESNSWKWAFQHSISRCPDQENESNSWKWAFQHSISRCPEPRKRIELLKTSFPTFDQSLLWTKKMNRTLENELSNIRSVVALNHRMLERSFSRVRFVYLVQGNDWSNVGKLVFKSSIRFLGSGQRLIECWKAHFQEFDSFSWFRQRLKKTNRTLENELSNIRSVVALNHRMLESSFSSVRFVFLVQGNDWSSIESSFSRVRFVFLVQGKDWSSVGKLIFKSSIRFLGSGQRVIERWKARFQEFDSFSWFRATTDRALESSFSRVRFVFLVQGNDWSNVGKLIFKSSIRFLGSGQRLIERWKAQFSRVRFVFLVQGNDWSSVTTDQMLESSFSRVRFVTWFRATTDRVLESSFSRVRFVYLVQGNDWSNVEAHFQEFDSFSWFRATTEVNESNSWKWAFQHSISRCPEPSSVGKLIFKSSIRFLGSGQGLIERWKAHFQEFDSFSWFRATTSRQRLIERWKARFQEFDSFSWFRATTDRALESSFSRVRFVFLVQATTDRMLESSFSRVRFVFLVQGKDRSNVGKLVFKSSIRFLGSGQRLKKTNRTLENELSNARSVVALNQENESNSWKRAFQHSIGPCPEPRKQIELLKMSFPTFDQSLPEPRKRIELLKMSFPTLDQSLPWTKKTNRTLENELSNIRSVVALNHRMLESSFSSVRFVFLVQGNDWSNVESSFSRVRFVFLVQGKDWSSVGKLVFKSSIRLLGSGQRLIERWKAHFQEFDSFSWFRATTEVNESNFWKRAFQHSISPCPEPRKRIELLKTSFPHSISRCPEPRKRIELLKMSFPTLDQSLPWTKKTNRTLENELSNARSVVALNQENESNSWKWAFQRSISRCPEPRKRIELLKMSFPTFDQSLPWTKETNRTLENELSNIRSVVALNQENESNSWKWAFQHSISCCPEPRKRIELLKMSFPTFDQSLPWTIECWKIVSRVRFVYLVQGNDWSNVGKLVFKSSIRFLGSGQGLIECWKAHFQEFDSFSWFRATTDRMLESSFSRVRFVFLVQGKDWSNVGKLIFKSSIRFLGSGQRLIECWKAHFQVFDSFSWFRATTDRALESSFSRVRFVFLVQGKDWSSVGKLIFKSSIRFLGSGQRLQGNEWSSVEKLVFKSSIRFLGSGQRLIERWKAHFQEFDSFSWFRATTEENESNSWKQAFQRSITRCLEVVALNQGNESNSWKWAFQRSISPCPEPRKRIELLKMSFPTLDQSLPWTKKTNRTLENELSNARSVVALNQENES